MAAISQKITIATSQYPPLTFLDETGSMAGISADYLRIISQRTGIKFEIKLLPWPDLMAQAKSREIDLFSGLKSSDRDEFLNFTSPYLDVSYVVINRVSGLYLRNFSNLNGQKVAVVNNWTIHKLLKNKFPKSSLTLEKRLNYELNIIKNMGYAGYFLITQDFVNYAKSNKIPVGPGRGSAVGSLVSYSLGITDLDIALDSIGISGVTPWDVAAAARVLPPEARAALVSMIMITYRDVVDKG